MKDIKQFKIIYNRVRARLYVVTLLYLTYIQSTSCKMPGWMKHKLESRLSGEISLNSDMQMTSPLWQKARGIKELLDGGERADGRKPA